MTFDNDMELATSPQEEDVPDALTGVCRDVFFEKNCCDYLQNSGLHGSHALFFLNIDNFKLANEVLGRNPADDILEIVGKLLLRTFRGHDIIGRTGGDEFMILMKDVPAQYIVGNRAEDLCRMIRQVFLDFEFPPGSCSIGAVFGHLGNQSFIESKADADLALYQAKVQGKGRWSIYAVDASKK